MLSGSKHGRVAFLTAITTFFKGDWNGDSNERYLPARQLDFSDPETASIFQEVHDLGSWVVNYDELLDRRQLLNQHVQVIRYQQGATQGRNLLISSTAPLGLLKSMVLNRAKSLNLDLSEDEYRKLTDRLIEDANNISGDIVLRAAKRGRNASELIGVVLSRYLIQRELAGQRYFGWYFLDDYAEWLGQREEQIADILALSPEVPKNGKLRLTAIISEAKFVDYASVAAKRKESQKQLRDTVKRIELALFGDPNRLDRDLWLSRFSDLLLQGIDFPAGARLDLAQWRRAVRDGDCEIYLRGYSHVFVSGPSDSPECSDFTLVADLDGAYQEVFSRARLRQVILAYWTGEDTTPIRKSLADQDVWSNPQFRKPSERITISFALPSVENTTSQHGAGTPTEQPAPQPGPAPAERPVTAVVLASPEGAPTEQVSHLPASVGNGTWAYPGFELLLEQHRTPSADNTSELQWLHQTESACKAALPAVPAQLQTADKFLDCERGALEVSRECQSYG